MIQIDDMHWLDPGEISLSYIRSSGPGGQNINKVNSAVMLTFDAVQSQSLDKSTREQLMRSAGSRIDRRGVITILARRFRSQELNRSDAIDRLVELIRKAAKPVVPRLPTRSTLSSRRKRVTKKLRRGEIKKGRQKVRMEE